MRNSNPQLFQSKLINYVWYGGIGFKAMLSYSINNLNEVIDLTIDDDKIVFPKPIQALVFLNIPSIYGGTNPWDLKKSTIPQACNDKVIEVFAVKSATHLARLQTPGQAPGGGIKIGQGKSILLETKAPLPAQVDGEPFELPPSRATITHLNQANMLFNKSGPKGEKKFKQLVSEKVEGGN